MTNNLVLISGLKQSGKDTLSDLFVGKLYKKIALADSLKQKLSYFLFSNFNISVPLHKFYGNNDTKNERTGIVFNDGTPMSIRKGLQWYGQLLKDSFGNDFWVTTMIQESNIRLLNCNCVISDVRFPYEINYIKQYLHIDFNIYTIRINRNTGFEDNDISETAFNDIDHEKYFDFVINNDGTLQELHLKFNEIFDKIHE